MSEGKMKFLFVLILVIAISVMSANAQDSTFEICKNMEAFAEQVMENRQDGVPMADMYELIMKLDVPKEAKESMFLILKAAFKEPRFSSEEYKKKAVVDFQNTTFLSCMEALKDK